MSCIYSTPPPLPCVLILIGGIVAKLVAGRNEACVNRADVLVLEKSIKEGSKNIRVDPGVETLRENASVTTISRSNRPVRRKSHLVSWLLYFSHLALSRSRAQ